MKKLFSLTIFLFCAVSLLFSQPWLQPTYFNQQNTDANFYDVKTSFDTWSQQVDISKEKGIKRYKRWEWFMEPRVYPSGNFPDPAINWKEWQKAKTSLKSLKDNANWASIAPANVPPSLDSTSIHGMGRINYIEFHPTDANIMLVCASQGGVWKTTDGASTWTCLTDNIPVMRSSCVTFDPNNPSTLYLATGDIDYIEFPTISMGRMTQYGVGVLKSTDGGATWNTTGLSFELTDEDNSLIRKIVVNKNNSNELLAAGPCGIYRSSDAGLNWTKVSSEKVIDVEINPLNDSTLYVATYFNSQNAGSKRILKSVDFGTTWTQLNTGIPATSALPRVEIAIAPSDTSVVYAMICRASGGLYAFYKTTDAGATWSQTATGPNVLGWFDGGKLHDINALIPEMDSTGQGTYDLTLVVDPLDANKVYSGGVNMWGSADGGVTWDIVSLWVATFGPSIHADQHYSVFSPHNGAMYQSNDGGIFTTNSPVIGSWSDILACVDVMQAFIDMQSGNMGEMTDYVEAGCYEFPTVWNDISGGLHITEYYRMAGCKINSDMIIGGSQDNGTYKYRNGEWINTFGGDGMEAMIDHFNDSVYYVTNYNGALSKTIDGGVTFTSSLEAPITDAGEAGDWVTPFVMHPVFTDTLYTAFQNVWMSPDGGITWEKISTIGTGASFRALAVAPSNTRYIYAARPGAIFRTKDRGATWTNITSGLSSNMITYISVSDRDPEKVFVTMSGYDDGMKVFMSSDAGDTWNNISGNLPNVSVNCIAFQDSISTIPMWGIYVGTDIGVYYLNETLLNGILPTKDLSLGESAFWISHTNGLPNVIVNELEIHYGAEKIRAATYGRGFWETDLILTDYNIGIKENSKESGLVKMYPNPAENELSIEIQTKEVTHATVDVFSIIGNKVIHRDLVCGNNSIETISLRSLKPGTYIVQVGYNNSHYSERIIKY